MADHPLRPATDRRLGKPLPHQQANQTRDPSRAHKAFPRRAYAVLASVSKGYSPLLGRFPRVTHPFATKVPLRREASVRLACVRLAASVRSEPGSNSQVDPPGKTRVFSETILLHKRHITRLYQPLENAKDLMKRVWDIQLNGSLYHIFLAKFRRPHIPSDIFTMLYKSNKLFTSL